MPLTDLTPKEQELTSGMFEVAPGLYMNNLGQFQNLQSQGADVPDQWAWGSQGLIPLGGSTENQVTPFMDILQQYNGGKPIEAPTWQDAVRKSLEGFMRVVYPGDPASGNVQVDDPAFLWNEQSGSPESQYRIGTLLDLIQDGTIPGNTGNSPFFDTGGFAGAPYYSVNVSSAHGSQATYYVPGNIAHSQAEAEAMVKDAADPTNPANKGKIGAGGERGFQPGDFVITQHGAQRMGGLGSFNPETGLGGMLKGITPTPTSQLDPLMGLSPQDKLLTFEDIPRGFDLEKILGPAAVLQKMTGTQDDDFNDYIFKLDLDKYAPAPQMIKANPNQVMQQYFDTPLYHMMFGNLDTTNPNMYTDPVNRFKADPAYQWQQDEGARQINRNSAAQGLLESGRTQRDLRQFGQNLANQTYNNWQSKEMAGFQDWQNQIKGLMGQGAGLSSQSAQAANQTGGGLANSALQSGSNLANVLANQGVFGGSGMMNTAAAQGANIMNAANINAQIAAANAAAQAQSGGSMMGGLGQVMGMLGGLF
jgi:hypothetical protein